MDLLKLSLATYLVAVTIARMHGPFGLAERMRHAIYRWRGFRFAHFEWVDASRTTPSGDRVFVIEDDWLTAGISCPVCLAPYVAAALLLAPGPAVTWLAVAGGAAAIFKLAHQ